MSNVDLEDLEASRFVHVLAQLFVDDGLVSEEEGEARDKNRAFVLTNFLGYNSTESYGRSNDDLGPYSSQAPRPYIPPTEQTEQGFVGLAPPVG